MFDRSFKMKIGTWNEVMGKFVMIFHDFYAQKDRSQKNRSNQKSNRAFLASKLRGVDRQSHGKTACDQHDRIERAKSQIQMMTRSGKSIVVHTAINYVRQKQSAEEHDFL